MLTSSTQLQNRSFHFVERTRTSTKCQKMKNARAKRSRILFFIVKYANLWGFCCRRRRACLSSLISATRRQRQRHTFCILIKQKQKHFTPLTSFFHFISFFHFSFHFISFLVKSSTLNDHFSSFTENVNTQAQILIMSDVFATVAS